jgi:hypothetical protein
MREQSVAKCLTSHLDAVELDRASRARNLFHDAEQEMGLAHRRSCADQDVVALAG